MALPFYTPASAQMGLMQPQQQGGLMRLLSDPNFQKALLAAGAGTLSARTGGNTGAAFGQGLMQGMQTYEGLKAQQADQAMRERQFGMQERRFEMDEAAESRRAAASAAELQRQKAFEQAVKGAYKYDEQGNVIGIDQQKYMAALATFDPDAYAKMLERQRQMQMQGYAPQQSTEGFFRVGPSGELSFLTDPDSGKRIMPIGSLQYDPTVKARIAQATAEGKATGEAVAGAQLGLGQEEAKTAQSLALIEKALAHPGRATATGASAKFDPRNAIPGTAAYDFNILSEQLKGQAFLEAFESLKGAGAITDREGQAATVAMARLDTAQSEQEYEKALIELRQIMMNAIDRQRQRAGQAPTMLSPQSANQPQGWGIRKLP